MATPMIAPSLTRDTQACATARPSAKPSGSDSMINEMTFSTASSAGARATHGATRRSTVAAPG